MDFQTILLDIDGTLLDFNASSKKALAQTFQNHDYILDKDTFQLYVQINTRLWREFEQGNIEKETIQNTRFVELFEKLNMPADGLSFERDYQLLLAGNHDLIAGAIGLLEYLYPKYDLYVVTNGVANTQKQRQKAAGIDKYMKDIFISELIGYQKPKKEFFEYCFKKIGNVNPDKTMIVGDSLTSDILGGNLSGIKTCWFNPKKKALTSDVQVDFEIHSLSELKNIL